MDKVLTESLKSQELDEPTINQDQGFINRKRRFKSLTEPKAWRTKAVWTVSRF